MWNCGEESRISLGRSLVDVGGGLTAIPFLLDLGCKPLSAVLISLMIGLSAGGFFDFVQKTIKGR